MCMCAYIYCHRLFFVGRKPHRPQGPFGPQCERFARSTRGLTNANVRNHANVPFVFVIVRKPFSVSLSRAALMTRITDDSTLAHDTLH